MALPGQPPQALPAYLHQGSSYLILPLLSSPEPQELLVLPGDKVHRRIFQEGGKHKQKAHCHPDVNRFDIGDLREGERGAMKLAGRPGPECYEQRDNFLCRSWAEQCRLHPSSYPQPPPPSPPSTHHQAHRPAPRSVSLSVGHLLQQPHPWEQLQR